MAFAEDLLLQADQSTEVLVKMGQTLGRLAPVLRP